MKRSFQPGMAAVLLTTAMLQASVPASAETITHTGNGIYNYPPITAIGDAIQANDTTTVNLLPGGAIEVYLAAFSNSTVNVSGGTVGTDLGVLDNSKMTIFGTGFNFAYGDYTNGESLNTKL